MPTDHVRFGHVMLSGMVMSIRFCGPVRIASYHPMDSRPASNGVTGNVAGEASKTERKKATKERKQARKQANKQAPCARSLTAPLNREGDTPRLVFDLSVFYIWPVASSSSTIIHFYLFPLMTLSRIVASSNRPHIIVASWHLYRGSSLKGHLYWRSSRFGGHGGVC